jgi:photosystem II stability/assembly factor-like uncharacterized protein
VDLGFLALTTDEGKTFRFVPTPWDLLKGDARLHCAGDRFFITRSTELSELVSDAWQRVGPAPSPSAAKFRGVVQAPGALYVATGTHVLVSRDGSTTFTPVLPGVDALASDGKDVFAAKDKDLYRVGDGDTLTLISTLKSSIRVLGFVGAELLAATERQLLRSEDSGSTWKPVPGAPSGIVEMGTFAGSLIVTTAGEVRVRDAKGHWSKLDSVYRARPGVSRLWLNYSGGYLAHLSKIGEALTPDSFPKDPMPTVRALAADGKALVAALYRPTSVHVSSDAGKTWLSACPRVSVDRAMLDGTRLQLAGSSWNSNDVKKCGTPGFRARFVPKLPDETCTGDLCVRFAKGALLRTRDRGKTWEDLTANLGGKADVVAAAASGRELIVARKQTPFEYLSLITEYSSFFRSIDDGRTFAPLVLPFKVTAFAPGADGWFFGTHLYGVVRVPYERNVVAPATGQPRR